MDDCPVPSPMDQHDNLRRKRREGMYTPIRDMLVPEVRERYDATLAEAMIAETLKE